MQRVISMAYGAFSVCWLQEADSIFPSQLGRRGSNTTASVYWRLRSHSTF